VVFFIATISKLAVGPTQSLIQLVTGALKWLGHAGGHLSLSSARIKNTWSYTSTPSYVFMEWYCIKYLRELYVYLDTGILHLSSSGAIPHMNSGAAML
jgi:hypothetical protein